MEIYLKASVLLIPRHKMGKIKATSNPPKRTDKGRNIPIPAETKLKVIELYQQGLFQAEIGHKMNVPRSTVCNIIEARDDFLSRTVPSKQTKFYKLFSELEMQSRKWVLEQAAKRNHLNGVVICHRARHVHAAMVAELDLEAAMPEASTSKASPKKSKSSHKTKVDQFRSLKASTGWLRNFKTRAELKRVKLHGESSSADTAAAEEFSKTLKKKIDKENLMLKILNQEGQALIENEELVETLQNS